MGNNESGDEMVVLWPLSVAEQRISKSWMTSDNLLLAVFIFVSPVVVCTYIFMFISFSFSLFPLLFITHITFKFDIPQRGIRYAFSY